LKFTDEFVNICWANSVQPKNETAMAVRIMKAPGALRYSQITPSGGRASTGDIQQALVDLFSGLNDGRVSLRVVLRLNERYHFLPQIDAIFGSAGLVDIQCDMVYR
jgi:hypothetical protein